MNTLGGDRAGSGPTDPCQAEVGQAERCGWQARLSLGFDLRSGRTLLSERRQSGPLAVQRPFYPEGGLCHCYVLHPPGGVVGGDRLELEVRVGAGAQALITMPGATKFYRSAGTEARVGQRLSVSAGAALEWLPQENILFPGALVRLHTQVDLEPGARFLGWEVQVAGRPAIGERFDLGRADLGLCIRRAGVPLVQERLRIHEGLGLDGPSGLRGYPVVATLAASGATASDLAALREDLLPPADWPWAATLVGDLLLVRGLAPGVEPVQCLMRSVWGILRPRLLGVRACPPRIWAT